MPPASRPQQQTVAKKGRTDTRAAQAMIVLFLVVYLVVNHFNQQKEYADLRTAIDELRQSMQKQIEERAQQTEKHYARLINLSKELTDQSASVSGLQLSVTHEREEAQKTLAAMREELQKSTVTTREQQLIIGTIKEQMEAYLKRVDKNDPVTSTLVTDLLIELEEVKSRLPSQTSPQGNPAPPTTAEPRTPRAEPVNTIQP